MKYILVSVLAALTLSCFEVSAITPKELEELRNSSPMRTRNHSIPEPTVPPPAPKKKSVPRVARVLFADQK